MRRIALLTAFALAAPVAAYAQPRVYERDRVYQRNQDDVPFARDRYDRYDRSHWVRDFRGRWTPLARGFSARTDRQFINVGGERFRKLRIEAVRDQPLIQKIAIEFDNRTTQAVDLDVRMPSGSGEVIDLNGGERRIHRIIVYTDPRSRGAYSLYGS